MSTVIFAVAAGLFCMKVSWNLLVPYLLAVRSYTGKSESAGISLVPMLEIALLLVAVGASALMDRAWPLDPGGVALLGATAIVASYGHLLLAGMISGWLARVFRRRGPSGRN